MPPTLFNVAFFSSGFTLFLLQRGRGGGRRPSTPTPSLWFHTVNVLLTVYLVITGFLGDSCLPEMPPLWNPVWLKWGVEGYNCSTSHRFSCDSSRSSGRLLFFLLLPQCRTILSHRPHHCNLPHGESADRKVASVQTKHKKKSKNTMNLNDWI